MFIGTIRDRESSVVIAIADYRHAGRRDQLNLRIFRVIARRISPYIGGVGKLAGRVDDGKKAKVNVGANCRK